jgi:ribosome-binding factor A
MTRKKTSSKRTETGPSQRMLRVGEQIRHAIAELLARGEIHDDVLASTVISISQVSLSPDLSLATAYVVPLGSSSAASGGPAAARAVIAALDKHKGKFRSQVAAKVNLRHAPEIRFRYDETYDRALRIDQILDSPKVRQDTGKAGPAVTAEPVAPGDKAET